MKTASIFWPCMRRRAFSMRPRRSSKVMGSTPAVMGLSARMASGTVPDCCWARARAARPSVDVPRKDRRFICETAPLTLLTVIGNRSLTVAARWGRAMRAATVREQLPRSTIFPHYLKVLFSAGPDDDGVVVLTADGSRAAVHRGGLYRVRERHAELHVKLLGSAGAGELDRSDHALRFRFVLEVEIGAAPTRGRLVDADGFAGSHPGARHTLGKIEAVFVVIFEGQHPADHAGDGLLRGDAEGRLAGTPARHFARRPTSRRMVVIAMAVAEQQILFDAVEADERLGEAVCDEAQDGTVPTAAHVGEHAHGGRSVSAHGVDHFVGHCGRQHTGHQQFGIETMRPLLFAGPFRPHR